MNEVEEYLGELVVTSGDAAGGLETRVQIEIDGAIYALRNRIERCLNRRP